MVVDVIKPETCSGFKVGRAQRPGKFRNLDVSGVVAVICIRHGCFRLEAIVDLQKGERCVRALYVGYSVSHARTP